MSRRTEKKVKPTIHNINSARAYFEQKYGIRIAPITIRSWHFRGLGPWGPKDLGYQAPIPGSSRYSHLWFTTEELDAVAEYLQKSPTSRIGRRLASNTTSKDPVPVHNADEKLDENLAYQEANDDNVMLNGVAPIQDISIEDIGPSIGDDSEPDEEVKQ